MYVIPKDITDDYLINHYGFKKVIWHDHYNLEIRDKDNLGLHIWWANRHVRILLGKHAEYGIAPIPNILIQMLKDGVIIKKGE